MTWYHVTRYYEGQECTFRPSIPSYLQKGEDKRNPRVCVTGNWKVSLMSIILLNRSCDRLYVYSTEEQPIDPQKERERLIKEKKIRKSCNDYQLPEDGIINKEKWFMAPIKMKFEGMLVIPKADRLGMLMGFGFTNEPDVRKYELVPYKKQTLEEMFAEMRKGG
jgi:hypothetical protein